MGTPRSKNVSSDISSDVEDSKSNEKIVFFTFLDGWIGDLLIVLNKCYNCLMSSRFLFNVHVLIVDLANGSNFFFISFDNSNSILFVFFAFNFFYELTK